MSLQSLGRLAQTCRGLRKEMSQDPSSRNWIPKNLKDMINNSREQMSSIMRAVIQDIVTNEIRPTGLFRIPGIGRSVSFESSDTPAITYLRHMQFVICGPCHIGSTTYAKWVISDDGNFIPFHNECALDEIINIARLNNEYKQLCDNHFMHQQDRDFLLTKFAYIQDLYKVLKTKQFSIDINWSNVDAYLADFGRVVAQLELAEKINRQMLKIIKVARKKHGKL
jgi:hypothetical protein